jgi:S1-C subfamily serine protease
LNSPEKPKTHRSSTALVAAVIICLLVGGAIGYAASNLTQTNQNTSLQDQISALENQVSNLQSLNSTVNSLTNQTTDLQSQISALQNQIASLQSTIASLSQPNQNVTNQYQYENVTYILGENYSLPQLYEQVKNSIVVVQGTIVEYDFFGRPYYATVQGSGFVTNQTGNNLIATNFHVVNSAINITVTFNNGDAYTADVTGSDAYADLAVLSTTASQSEYEPLTITSSSTLKVGDPVLAIGNPYGLAGSITTGIVSALGRTITETTTGTVDIADCIQTTTAINPGNSGGPLLNVQGEVVGITTAIVTNSQGLGFAIPSTSILREITALATTGSYTNHPWLGASGIDMTLPIAQAMSTDVTYGWLVTQITNGGPAYQAGLHAGTTQTQIEGSIVTIGGDIITAINGTRIRNTDDLLAYIEENTLPNQTINITIIRSDNTQTVPLTLGTRPPP